MTQLKGQVVRHKAFGIGSIIFNDNFYVEVLFEKDNAIKKFQFPSSFDEYIKFENLSLQKQVEEYSKMITLKKAENQKQKEEIQKTNIINASKPISRKTPKLKDADKSNIAFKCNYCDGGSSKETVGFQGVCSDEVIEYNIRVAQHVWCAQSESMCYKYWRGEISRKDLLKHYSLNGHVCYESQMLSQWCAYAGIFHNGENEGKPMTLRNLRANSLAVLTTRQPYDSDKDRFIFAVYLIDDGYEGDSSEEGYVSAHQKFRLKLSLEEASQLKFWDYYFNSNNPKKIIFGSGLHRYLTDIQSVQILKTISKLKKKTTDEALANEFLNYYCTIKKIDINNIPNSNGALQRE